jgi:hypothetical protein
MDAETRQMLLWLLQAIGAGFCSVLWVSFRDLKTKADRLAQEFADYKVHVAENHATRRELQAAIEAFNKSFEAFSSKLEIKLDRIEVKLDNKQDK